MPAPYFNEARSQRWFWAIQPIQPTIYNHLTELPEPQNPAIKLYELQNRLLTLWKALKSLKVQSVWVATLILVPCLLLSSLACMLQLGTGSLHFYTRRNLLKPPNNYINEYKLHKIHWLVRFEALKLWNAGSGMYLVAWLMLAVSQQQLISYATIIGGVSSKFG